MLDNNNKDNCKIILAQIKKFVDKSNSIDNRVFNRFFVVQY